MVMSALVSPLVVGIVLWRVGYAGEKRKIKSEAIRDLMTYRGDFASVDFRRSLNKIAITFHDDEIIRNEVRTLYAVINDSKNNSEKTKRTIVGLIYKLCKKNGFKGLTEYDIDQAFTENNQEPNASNDVGQLIPAISIPTPLVPISESEKKKE